MDEEALPLLRDTFNGEASPEVKAFEYDPVQWKALMDWLERRASIDLLRGMKAGEPPITDPRHASWQEHYDRFKEKVNGFIKARALGIVDDPETVYFVIQLFLKAKEVSDRALGFLRVKERPHLGEAERPPELEVTLLGDSTDDL